MASIHAKCDGQHALVSRQRSSLRARPSPALQRRTRSTPAAAARQQARSGEVAYPYNGGDDTRQKATIEQVFQPPADLDADPSTSTSTSTSSAPPWSFGWQMSERNIVWNDDLKLRLIKHVAAQELGLPEAQLEQRLADLDALLPGLGPQLVRAPPRTVAQLAANTAGVAERLLALKAIFPEADLSAMVSKRFSLLLTDSLADVAAAAQRLKQLLPAIHTDYFVEAHPTVLDIEDFERALADAARIMPQVDVVQMLRQNPDVVLSLQKGKNLIPYDQIENPFS